MPDEVVQTPFGKFLIDPIDLIGSTLKAGTLWDGPGFLQVIAKEYARLGEPGITVLDVGANQGAFSVWLASQGAWRVVAVEPIPQTMQRLKANLDLNREVCAGVVVPIATAGYSCKRDLWWRTFDAGNTGETTLTRQVGSAAHRVHAIDLDQYGWLWQRGLSLIKIDAQGCDGAILHGLQETIDRWHPAIVFEWEAELAAEHEYTHDDVWAFLQRQGYVVQPWPSQPNNYLASSHTFINCVAYNNQERS